MKSFPLLIIVEGYIQLRKHCSYADDHRQRRRPSCAKVDLHPIREAPDNLWAGGFPFRSPVLVAPFVLILRLLRHGDDPVEVNDVFVTAYRREALMNDGRLPGNNEVTVA